MNVFRAHYNVILQSISVNGQTLSIDPSTFAISNNQGGTIIDSGTTLAYLAKDAYTPFVDAVSTIDQNLNLVYVFEITFFCNNNVAIYTTLIWYTRFFLFVISTGFYRYLTIGHTCSSNDIHFCCCRSHSRFHSLYNHLFQREIVVI